MNRLWVIFTATGVLIALAVTLTLRSQSAEDEESWTLEDYYTRINTLRKVDGNYEQAAQEALAFLQVYQEKDMLRQKIYYEYAAALFQQENFDDAKIVFNGLVDEYAGTALDKSAEDFFVDDAQFFAAMLEQTQGDKDNAIAGYKYLVENFPESNRRADVLITLGDINRENKKWQKSLDYYYRVVEEYPQTNSAANALRCANKVLIETDKDAYNPDIEGARDNSKEVERNIENLLKNYPDNERTAEAVFNVMNYFHMRGDIDKAISYCEVMFDRYPAYEKTRRAILDWVDLITLREGEERYDEAIEWIELIRNEAIQSEDAELYENALFFKGLALKRKRDPDGAINHFQWMIDTYSGMTTELEVRLRFFMASCYMEKEEYENAIEELEKAPSEDAPCDWPVVITYTIGCCYQALHDVEKTKEYYDRVIAEYPDTSWAKSIEKDRADVEELKKSRSETK